LIGIVHVSNCNELAGRKTLPLLFEGLHNLRNVSGIIAQPAQLDTLVPEFEGCADGHFAEQFLHHSFSLELVGEVDGGLNNFVILFARKGDFFVFSHSILEVFVRVVVLVCQLVGHYIASLQLSLNFFFGRLLGQFV